MFVKYKSLGLTHKKNLVGYLFISPFLIGFVLFFLNPLFGALKFSFNDLTVTVNGLQMDWVGGKHYYDAFMVDPEFRQILVQSIIDMVTNVPIIIIFSFFASTLLNQSFRGRFLARAIFFLPVILASGIIGQIEQNDAILKMMQNPADDAANLGLLTFDIETVLIQSRIPPVFVEYVLLAIDRIYQVISDSGVQILIFLAGLQSIPSSLFEAAKVEGATGWESFWKITFPMVSPLILVNMIYSIIDSFTKSDNELMEFIHDKGFVLAKFGFASALAWIYMGVIALMLLLLGLFYQKRVFYHE